MVVTFYIQPCAYNNLRDLITHIFSHRVKCPCMDECTYRNHRMEGNLPHSSLPQESLAASQSPTHCASLRVSRTLHCCVTLKARWPEGGRCLLCQSDNNISCLFVLLQGQFAMCDLSKANVIWQELLTSEDHPGDSEDTSHIYSFGDCLFVIFKVDIPFCFRCWGVWCTWGWSCATRLCISAQH